MIVIRFSFLRVEVGAYEIEKRRDKMGIASLVLGIITAIICWIPCFSWFAVLPAIVGIVLGACAIKVAKKNNGQGKGIAVAGLVLSIIALIIAIIWIIICAAAAASTTTYGIY